MALGNSTTPAIETRIKPNFSRSSDASATATGNQYTNKTSTTKIIGSYWRDRGKIFYQINTNIVTILEKTRYYLFILSIFFFFYLKYCPDIDSGKRPTSTSFSLSFIFTHTHTQRLFQIGQCPAILFGHHIWTRPSTFKANTDFFFFFH